MKIAVLYGGNSNERPISIETGKSVMKYIDSKKYEVFPIDFNGDFEQLIRKIKANGISLVFIALHGGDGENGLLQNELEKNNINFTGSGSIASKDAMDKNKTKKICLQNEISTAPWFIIDKDNQNYLDAIGELAVSRDKSLVVFKPVNEGSSFDLFIIDASQISSNSVLSELREIHIRLLGKYGSYMIEKYVDGRELTVGIIGDIVLPVVEILPKNNFYDYDSKYIVGMSDYIVPADLDESILIEINHQAMKLYEKLNCRHYGRIDIRLDRKNNVNILELNTLPGMTSTSLLPKAAISYGINYSDLVEKIIKLAG